MLRVTTVLLAVVTATALVGCGNHGDHGDGLVHLAADAAQFKRPTRMDALPQGHPPVARHHRALPEGHPPVAGHGHGLPQGHPVCPAGRQMLERGTQDGAGDPDVGPRLIST